MSDDIPEWAIDRALLLTHEAGECRWTRQEVVDSHVANGLRALARYIAKHEPEPVDPLLVMAREAAGCFHSAIGFRQFANSVCEGKQDTSPSVQSALTALRMAKEQGLPE